VRTERDDDHAAVDAELLALVLEEVRAPRGCERRSEPHVCGAARAVRLVEAEHDRVRALCALHRVEHEPAVRRGERPFVRELGEAERRVEHGRLS
jgi:hypothetical protein